MTASKILQPGATSYALAADALRRGLLVGLPTETVYGLAANALNEDAVRAVYRAKGRPQQNPLIVHVADATAALRWVRLAPKWESAWSRLTRFWPGPLTIVTAKSREIPSIVTAGADTVGLRAPAHPVAREVLRRCEFPIAAPSANPSNYVSPTTAEHVATGLSDQVAWILDGGPSDHGLESTIVALDDDGPRVLRYGAIPVEELAAGCPELTIDVPSHVAAPSAAALLSPGRMSRHYAPRTPVYLPDDWPDPVAGGRFARLMFGGAGGEAGREFAAIEDLGSDLPTAARRLFRRLASIGPHGIGRNTRRRLRRNRDGASDHGPTASGRRPVICSALAVT